MQGLPTSARHTDPAHRAGPVRRSDIPAAAPGTRRTSGTGAVLGVGLGGGRGRGHRTFAGTAEQVAEAIEYGYDSGAADGFHIMPAVLPPGPEVFVDRVVPILQERGLFRTEYAGATLREHYGLPRQVNRLSETAGAR